MARLFQITKHCVTGYWATGPILGKELRIAGRQKRYYTIRLVYILTLLAVLVITWADLSINFSALNISVYLTAVVGQICRMIAMVQFYGAQAAAVFLLCGVIAEETRKRTLGVLLSTPITSFQIIGGKLFSKLLQVWLLLALSLPIYAILRVYGGIPWDFVIQTTVVTLAAVFFVASVTLLIGTFFRRSYTTLIVSVVVIILYYALANNWELKQWLRDFLPGTDWTILSLNPFYVFSEIFEKFDIMSYRTRTYLTSTLFGSSKTDCWAPLLQSVMILGLSLLLLAVAARRVRKLALKELSKQNNRQKRKFKEVCESLVNRLPRISRRRHIRDVRGAAMVWKEMHNSLIRGELLRGRYIYLLLIGAIAMCYGLFILAKFNDVEEMLFHVITCLAAGAVLVTSIAAASSISKEKETASWQILLTTPLSDSEILWGKILGIVRRSAVLWAVLLLLLAILSYAGLCRFTGILMTAVIAAGMTSLLTGVGIYLSVRFRSTPRAVMILLFAVSLLWVAPPVLCEFIWDDFFELTSFMHPLSQIFREMRTLDPPDCFRQRVYLNYEFDWLEDFLESGFFIVFNAICYAAVGAVFAWRAKVNLRRKIC